MTSTTDSPQGNRPALRRDLSRWAIAALAINGIIGAGIFGLPGKATDLVGAFSPVTFIVCGVLMSSLMASFAQAASYFKGTGGPVLYAHTAFGEFTGFQVGWMLWVARTLSLAANANLLVTYLFVALHLTEQTNLRVLILTVLAVSIAAINIVGVKRGMATILVITVAKLVPLLIFVLVGISFVSPTQLGTAELPTFDKFGEGVLLVFYAFLGFETALVPAGESRDPKRDIPWAMLWTAAVVTIFYLLVQSIFVSVAHELPTAKSDADKPLALASGFMLGNWGTVMISIGAVISILGNYASAVLTVPRITFALAEQGMLPRMFAAVSERFGTPHVSILFYCAIGLVLSMFGSFKDLAIMSTLSRLLVYATSVAALPVLRRRYGQSADSMKLPGGLAIPGLAFVICLWLVAQKIDAAWMTGTLIAVGAVMYFTCRRSR